MLLLCIPIAGTNRRSIASRLAKHDKLQFKLSGRCRIAGYREERALIGAEPGWSKAIILRFANATTAMTADRPPSSRDRRDALEKK